MSTLVPHQHGAWAFLALPVSLAAARLRWHPIELVLTIAWVASYPLSWALAGTLTAPRPERFRPALLVWGPPALTAAAVATYVRPWLLWVGALHVAGFLVSLGYARKRSERALGNDLVLVAQCALMVPVLVAAGSQGGWLLPLDAVDAGTWSLTVLCAAALVGSTLHVKSLIRERRNPRYARASRVFAVACLPVSLTAAWAYDGSRGWLLVVPFVVLLLRSIVVYGSGWRPAQVGLVELACLVLLAACAFLA